MGKKMNFIKNIMLILSMMTLYSCAQDNGNSMSVTELKEAVKTDSSLVILDVRTPAELTGPLGKIDGVINIPVQELEDRLGELEIYKDKNIAVICRSGNRSGVAQKILTKHGFNAKNVLGGMIDYRKSE